MPNPPQAAGIGQRRIGVEASIGIQTNRVHRRIDDAEFIVFRKRGVLERDSRLHVVDALHVGKHGASPGIRQGAVLANGVQLQIRGLIGKGVRARVVVVLIAPHKSAQSEDRSGIDQPGPRRRDVECSDLRTLILRSNRLPVRSQAAARTDLSWRTNWGRREKRPSRCIFRVVGIGRLKPGAAVAEIETEGVLWRKLKVHAVEEILLIAAIVYDAEFRSVEKPRGVQAVGRNVVAPLVAAVRQVESPVYASQTIRRSSSPAP